MKSFPYTVYAYTTTGRAIKIIQNTADFLVALAEYDLACRNPEHAKVAFYDDRVIEHGNEVGLRFVHKQPNPA